MIKGGNASVYVTDIDRAVTFWTEAVGLPLKTRVGTTWAEIDAGDGLIIGIHQANPPDTVPAGQRGAVNIELKVTEPIEEVVAAMESRGVKFKGPILYYEAVNVASFYDPDWNVIELGQVLKA